MIAKLQNPIAVAGLSVMLSVGLGIGLTWRTVSSISIKAASARPLSREATELKKKGWDFWTIEIDNLSNELKEERARLKKQAELLDQRAARVTAEEKELAKMRADIE